MIDWASEGPDAKPLWSETKAYALSALDSKKLWWKRVDRLLRDAGGVDASRAFVRISAKASSVGDGAAAAAAINRAMEGLILQCPQQYLWGYHRYKEPRGLDIGAAPARES